MFVHEENGGSPVRVTLYTLSRALSGINFVHGGSRHFGTQRSCRSLAANSTRGEDLDLLSPKSRKTITKLERTKCSALPLAHFATYLPCLFHRGNFLRWSSSAAGNCSERNRYIADFKVGQRGSPPFLRVHSPRKVLRACSCAFPHFPPLVAMTTTMTTATTVTAAMTPSRVPSSRSDDNR